MEILTIVILIIFLITIIIVFIIGKKFGEIRKNKEWENQVSDIRGDAVARSRAVLSGNFSEQLSPYLPNFKYNPSDCKFLGKPVDFIVFNGLSEGELKNIVFLEVKSGDSKLNNNQKDVKKTIQDGNVFWDEYRVDKRITKGD